MEMEMFPKHIYFDVIVNYNIKCFYKIIMKRVARPRWRIS